MMRKWICLALIAMAGLGCSQFRGLDPGDYDTQGLVGSACEWDSDCDNGMQCHNGYCRGP